MAHDVILPRLDQDMTEGVVTTWHVQLGDAVREGDPLVEIESDKVTTDVESPRDGVVVAVRVEAGATVDVGSVIAVVGDPGEIAATPEAPDTATEPEAPATATEPEAAPAAATEPDGARRLALPVDRSAWQRPHTRSPRTRFDVGDPAPHPAPEQPEDDGESELIPIRGVRTAIVAAVEASQRVPQFGVTVDVRAERLTTFLAELRAHVDTDAPRVSLSDLLARAVAVAVGVEPGVNAWWEAAGIRRFRRVHVGLLVQVEQGLYNVRLPDCDRRTVGVLARDRARLVALAQAGELARGDLASGTITLSNLGMYGIDGFTALVFPPQVAVVAVGRIRDDEPGAPMSVTVSVDHRAVDGAMAARYATALRDVLEHPATLAL